MRESSGIFLPRESKDVREHPALATGSFAGKFGVRLIAWVTPVLTDTLIRNAKPKDKPYKLPRENGLYVIVNPTGSKWWRFSYRLDGKEKGLSFGTYPLIPLSLARLRRDEARLLVASKIDPSARRREAMELKSAHVLETFAVVTDRWETEETATNSDEYRANIKRLLQRDILPFIGHRPLISIKTPDLINVLDRIRERGVDDTARRARIVIGQVFRYAIRRGITEVDPTQALRGERRVTPVSHFAAFTEPSDVTRLMRAIYSYKGSPEVRAALKP